MKKILISLILISSLLIILPGCEQQSDKPILAKDTGAIVDDQATIDSIKLNRSDTTKFGETNTVTLTDGQDTVDGIELNHSYTTKFGETNAITFPDFSFDYPDGWTITNEEVTSSSEEVVLTNQTGLNITYWNFGKMRDLTGPTRYIKSIDITKAADAKFSPGYVQASDYSDLGAFMVAKIKVTGEYDTLNGGEYVEIEDGNIRYALLPDSQMGEQGEIIKVGLPTLSFWYAGHISVIANTPNDEFTQQEEREVIAILSSFRDNSTPSKSSSTTEVNVVTSIGDLWNVVDGRWALEEYKYRGSAENYTKHDMKFQYNGKTPCISRDYHSDESYITDTLFYDISSMDEFHYDIYTYKRDSYGGEGDNWSSDVRLVWWRLDLSNLSNDELKITYNIAMDDGSIDNYNSFKYIRD